MIMRIESGKLSPKDMGLEQKEYEKTELQKERQKDTI